VVVALAVERLVSVCTDKDDMLEVAVCNMAMCDEDCDVNVEAETGTVVAVFIAT
jgi:hypothetical protein